MDAKKQKLGRVDALAMVTRVSRIVVSKGKKVIVFEPTKAGFDREAFLAAALGPTGNLRAPTILRGKTMFVGFNQDAYATAFA